MNAFGKRPVKTIEREIGEDISVEISCADGSIVKVEIYNKLMGDWFDVTDSAKNNGVLNSRAEREYEEYCEKVVIEMNYKGIFDDIFGDGPKGAA